MGGAMSEEHPEEKVRDPDGRFHPDTTLHLRRDSARSVDRPPVYAMSVACGLIYSKRGEFTHRITRDPASVTCERCRQAGGYDV